MVREDIFSIEDGLLVINKPYVRGIPEFRVILERDKGSEGDSDGRKKLYSFKELFYVVLRGNRYSYINKRGYPEKEAHKLAVKDARLPDNFRADTVIKLAIERYSEIQLDTLPTLANIETLQQALYLSDKVAKNIIGDITHTLELRERVIAQLPEGEPTNITVDIESTNTLIAKLDQVYKLAERLPKTTDTLAELRKKLELEEAGSDMVRGGRKKGNRADPK